MNEKKLHLEITTPEKVLISEDVNFFVAPGVDGEFQILPGHTPFLTDLKIGHIIFNKNGKTTHISISGGFCEFKQNKTVILAHTAEKVSDIDETRAQEAKNRAEKRLENKNDPSIDEERAKLALFRAINRLELLEYR
ncbi:F0F1 ATP synthase subunit epsilon [Candidatus Latescibacterota bacterium]